jgi:hypothetical protein
MERQRRSYAKCWSHALETPRLKMLVVQRTSETAHERSSNLLQVCSVRKLLSATMEANTVETEEHGCPKADD